jgi:hypothetical protein
MSGADRSRQARAREKLGLGVVPVEIDLARASDVLYRVGVVREFCEDRRELGAAVARIFAAWLESVEK